MSQKPLQIPTGDKLMDDLNKKVADMLLVDEGYTRTVYVDTTGHMTVGIGRNLDDKGISMREAQYLLNNDIADAVANAYKALPNGVYDSLTYNQKLVVICMIFNMGLSKYLTFKKMIAAIINKDSKEVVAEMLQSKWHDDVGARAERLANLWTEG